MASTSRISSSNYKPGEYFRRYQQERRAETEEEIFAEEETDEERSPQREITDEVQTFEDQSAKTPAVQVNKKRKAPQNQTKNKKAKKFSWTNEKVEDLLKYIMDYKSNCDFKGIDFEADLASMYTEVRKCMARDYTSDFGPEQTTVPEMEIKEMNKAEYDSYIKKAEAEKTVMKTGYSRIKEKIKALRQDYRNAVNRGTRSGSGRIVQENYDLLAEIWGGSPATSALSFGVDSSSVGQAEDDDSFDDSTEHPDGRANSHYDDSTSETGDNSSTKSDHAKAKLSPPSTIPKLVDNKRKHMEKRLSQAQRDQVLMNSAKEDMLMKKNMEIFEKSNKTLEDSINKMTTCLTSLGDGIAAGMQMMVVALSQSQPPTSHLSRPAHPFPVTQAHSHIYPGQYGVYAPFNQQFSSTSSTRNQTTLSSTHGALSAANQTLYNLERNDCVFS